MSPYSIYDNLLYEGFGETNEPDLSDIFWDDDRIEVTIELTGLSNITVNTEIDPVLYRLTIIGGDSGIMDINGNTMVDNFSFEFRESE